MNLSHSARAKGRVALAVAGATIVSVATFSMGGSTVSAHHPLITASAACATDGAFTINYTSTAWEGFGDDPSRTNQNVIIYANVNGGGDQQVDSGAFVSPNFSFSGQFSVPASTTSLDVPLLGHRGAAERGPRRRRLPADDRCGHR